MYRDHEAAARCLPAMGDEVPSRFAELVAHRWARATMGGLLLLACAATLAMAIPFICRSNALVPRALEAGWILALVSWPLIWLLSLWLAPKAPRNASDGLSRWQQAQGAARRTFVAARLRRIETIGMLPLFLGLTLAMPLTLHLVVGGLFGASVRNLGDYTRLALIVTWAAHVIVARHAWRTFYQVKRKLDAGLHPERFASRGVNAAGLAGLLGPALSALTALLVLSSIGRMDAEGALSIFFVVAIVGGFFVFLTGLLYLPLLYHVLLGQLVRERREIEAALPLPEHSKARAEQQAHER